MAHTIVLTSNRPAIAAIMTTALIVHLPDLNPRSDSAFWAAPIVHQIAEPGLLEVNKRDFAFPWGDPSGLGWFTMVLLVR
ncbi:hypothetical protein BMS3Bbin01_02066 [bacterium BMS3Bbin01]|nr:hypothetical protein BMS3Bbin01_02066 [bacterium BMS3Bbin01]